MQLQPSGAIAVILFFVPAVITGSIVFRKRKAKQESRRLPFNELPRRPAGEAARLKLRDLDDKISETVFFAASVPAVVGIVYMMSSKTGLAMFAALFATCALVTWGVGMRLYNLVEARSNCCLGYEGERFVGEEISRLMALGFHVYHDIPCERDGKTFNIDHVLVGRRGIFAIETKAHRKPLDEDQNAVYRVEFNGKCLQWSWGDDDSEIKQAKDNAVFLANELRQSTGTSVWVTAILTLPGWMVERRAPCSDVQIFNPKEIWNFCACQPDKVPLQQVESICYQLDQRCKIAVS